MKSLKAKEFIESDKMKYAFGGIITDFGQLHYIVELAEEEMREQAIEAFKKECKSIQIKLWIECKSDCSKNECIPTQTFIELLDKTE